MTAHARRPPLPFCLPESPPVSPEDCGTNSLNSEKPPAIPRTPRKPKHPRQSTPRDEETNSAIVRFQLVQHECRPVLKIRTTTRSGRRSVLKARRRLWNREHEPLEFVELAPTKPRELESAYEDRRTGDQYADNTDADDEMDRASPGPTSFVLSPPYSPQDFNTEPDAAPVNKTTTTTKVKTCASCKTRKTPLWRDSEDGTPHCNACGIRFKKYRIRCSSCSYIPRKDEKIGNICCLCGSRLVHCRLSGH